MATTGYTTADLIAMVERGDARVTGRTCDGHAWPEGRQYWIVELLADWAITHVPADEAPTTWEEVRA